jgi:hypothetical protein
MLWAALAVTTAISLATPSSQLDACVQRVRPSCKELDVGLGMFMRDHNLNHIVMTGRKAQGDTHRWIHSGVFDVLRSAAPNGTNVDWLDGHPGSPLPPPHSLVVTTLQSAPHQLATEAPPDLTSRYILLINEGHDTYTGANKQWMQSIVSVMWAPYTNIAPKHPTGMLLAPWPGPVSRCDVAPPACIDELTAAAHQRGPVENSEKQAVFVGTLWKPDQISNFIAVVDVLKRHHGITTVQFGRCLPCKDNQSFAAAHGFEARGELDTEGEAAAVIDASFLTFDLRYKLHVSHAYVPDRWFRAASRAKLVVTNSPHASTVLAGAVVAEPNITTMIDRAVQLLSHPQRLNPTLKAAAAIVGEQHTYVGPPLFVNSDAFVNTARLHTHVPLECSWYDSYQHWWCVRFKRSAALLSVLTFFHQCV